MEEVGWPHSIRRAFLKGKGQEVDASRLGREKLGNRRRYLPTLLLRAGRLIDMLFSRQVAGKSNDGVGGLRSCPNHVVIFPWIGLAN